MVFNVKRNIKLILLISCVLILSVLALRFFICNTDSDISKVDRTNAMQVAKPLATQQFTAVAAVDFFTEYRLERERLRSEKAEALREMIRNADSDDTRQKAQEEIIKQVTEKQRESEMENLIKARGFADALVFIGDNKVNAVVKVKNLQREEVVQVADIISRVGRVNPEDITISARP